MWRDFSVLLLTSAIVVSLTLAVCGSILFIKKLSHKLKSGEVRRTFLVGLVVDAIFAVICATDDVVRNSHASQVSWVVLLLSAIVCCVLLSSREKERRERDSFRASVIGFASCLVFSDAVENIYLGDVISLIDSELDRIHSLKSAPAKSDDPLYYASPPEFASLCVEQYARDARNALLIVACQKFRKNADSYRMYNRSYLSR